MAKKIPVPEKMNMTVLARAASRRKNKYNPIPERSRFAKKPPALYMWYLSFLQAFEEEIEGIVLQCRQS